LIGNGIKYCEAEILVHVTAKPVDGSLWQFSVKDNGIGIPEKNYHEVFEPFTVCVLRLNTKARAWVVPRARKLSSVTGASFPASQRKATALLFCLGFAQLERRGLAWTTVPSH